MRINPSLTIADGGSLFILTSVPSSRQILWLLVTVWKIVQSNTTTTKESLRSSCNHMKWTGNVCVGVGSLGGLQFYKLAGVRGHNTFSSRWGKEDKKKERKKKKSSGWSLTKGKKEEEEKLRLVRHGFDIFRILSDTLLMCDSLAQMGRGKKCEGDVGDGQGNGGRAGKNGQNYSTSSFESLLKCAQKTDGVREAASCMFLSCVKYFKGTVCKVWLYFRILYW